MVTLHILKLLEDNGFGTLALTGAEANASLFFEKLPIQENGIFIMSRGAPLSKGQRTTQSFDLYSRGENDVVGMQVLEEILAFFKANAMCTLPSVPGYSDKEYVNVSITPTGNIQNVGIDDTDRVIYLISAEVRYNN